MSAEGDRLLRETGTTPITPHNHLQLITRLRQQIDPARAQAVIETLLLRQLAAVKFSRADRMFFTRAALEQASSEIVSTYRAKRFAAAGFTKIADLGCGIGGDALALAAVGDSIGVDLNPVRLAMAAENVRVYGHSGRFTPLEADLATLLPDAKIWPFPVQALFFDPARRDAHGRRIHSVRQYRPPLSLMDQWRRQIPDAAVKISPGVDYAELPDDTEIEFISVKGEVKEGVLWFGELRTGVNRRATLLPGEHTLSDEEGKGKPIPATSPRSFLYEPDKAVIRAHLVEQLAARLNATKIDVEIAYLTAGMAQQTPFARCYAIEATFPFQLKRLRHYLREHRIGRITIKKRGSPLDPDELRRRLRLRGEGHRFVFLTHVLGEAAVLIGQAVS
ncbi:MAG: class I SAM-dependent methyltransferase [Anaerolineae bacterium]